MMNDLADMLLRRVYHPIIAVICADGNDHIVHIELLDALFADTRNVTISDAERIYLVFSHPDGRQRMTREEMAVLAQIEEQAGKADLHVFLYNEDDGLLEVDRKPKVEYNGENVI